MTEETRREPEHVVSGVTVRPQRDCDRAATKVWNARAMLARLVRVRWIPLRGILLLVVACSSSACASSRHDGQSGGGGSPTDISSTKYPSPDAGGLTARQRVLATRVAHRTASGADPQDPGIARHVVGWPSYVDTVAATVLPYQQAVDQLDGQGGADLGQSLVVRLTGHFAVITTGPPGQGSATGTVITAVVSLKTGQSWDSGVTNQAHPRPLPHQTLLYQR